MHTLRTTIEDDNTKISEKDLFKLILQFKDYGIIMLSPSRKVFVWNLGAQSLWGYSGKEMIGKLISNVYQNESTKEQHEFFLEQAQKYGRVEFDSWEKTNNNTSFYVNTIVFAFYHADGSIKGFAKICRDITVYKKLEEENALLKEGLEEKVRQRTRELEVVNKELEAFSYSVSHDLRTPLRAVSGYSTMLKEDYETVLDNEANRIINNIIHNTKMMGQLIDDLLTFSKMARLEVINVSIDMKQLAANCLNDLLEIEKSPVNVSLSELPHCNGDNSMLRQVWYNLLNNAIKYTSKKEKPAIEMGALDNQHFNVYYVKDNGEGFDMKYASKLFGVFQRLHRQDEFEGTGLGLALIKRIVSKHGGDIWAEATLGKGATFYFSIPKKISNEQ